MSFETAQIVQTMNELWQSLVGVLSSAVLGLWHRDELLFIAVVVIFIQTGWILSLRFRLRRLSNRLNKAKNQGSNPEDKQIKNERSRRAPMWTSVFRGAQPKDLHTSK